MSIFGSQFMDFFGVGHRRNTSDDAFLDVVKSHPDIVKEAYLSNCIVCCPVSTSLGNEIIPKEIVISHVLVPGRIPGEFISLSGQHVHISGNYLVCGVGYKEARKVKIVNVGSLTDTWGKTISIYYIHRPLVGGLNAPEEVDEMSTTLMLKYVATLKSFADAKQPFMNLDDYIREMKSLGRMSSLDGFNKIRPTLSAALRTQWQRACERIARSEAIVAHLGGGDVDKARQHIYQIIESYILHGMVEFVYPWLCRRVDHGETSIHNLMEGIHLCTQSDLGVAPEFQTNQSDAIRELCSIVEAQTPAEKMLVFTKVINLIREAIDMVVSKKFPSTEVEFATDDLVCVLIWVIIQAYPYYRLIVVDLLYCKEFHFCNSSRTQLGYNMCHIEVAVSWFTRRAKLRRPSADQMFLAAGLLSAQSIEESDNEGPHHPVVEHPEGELGVSSASVQDAAVTVESAVRKLSTTEEDLMPTVAPPVAAAPVPGAESAANNDIGTLKVIADPHHSHTHHHHHPLSSNVDAWPTLLVPDNLRANLLWAKHQSQWDSEGGGTAGGQSLFTHSKDSLGCSEELGISTDKNSAGSVEALVAAAVEPTVEHSKPPTVVEGKEMVCGKHFMVLDVYNWHRGGSSKQSSEMQCILSEDTNKPDPIVVTAGFGDYFAALTVSGNPYTWGQPECGRLGRGVTQELDFFFPVHTPTPVSGLAACGKIKQLSCGKGHMLAVTENGEMFVWGDNRCGQLGLFDMSVKSSNRNSGNKLGVVAELAVSSELAMVQATSPTLLEAMAHIKVCAVACGAHHSLCLGVDGNVYSWGRAANGRLGQLSEKSHTAEHLMGRPAAVRSKWQPSAPLTLAELSSLRPSWSESAGFGGRGVSMSPSMTNLHGAGSTPAVATVMSPTSTRSLSPTATVPPPPTASRVVFIAAGFNYSVAVTSCGAVFSWGCGTYGALGHGSHCDEYIPRQVMSLRFPGAKIVSASASHHTLFLASNGLLYGCGLNNKRQVQALPEVSSRHSEYKLDSSSVLVARPIEIPSSFKQSSSVGDAEDRLNSSGHSSGSAGGGVTRVKGMSCGDFHTAVLTEDNRLLVWGDVELKGTSSVDDDASQNGSMRDITHLIPAGKQVKQAQCSGNTITVLVD